MHIEPATPHDLPSIRAAYASGRRTQLEQGSSIWPEFSEDAILGEVASEQLFRVVVEEAIAGVFSVAYEDPAIWGPLERGAHLYLHRIARSAEWSGGGLMDGILAWAADQCRALGRAGVRVDTWASNAALIAFYRRRGFRLVDERRRIGVDPRLPPHYHHCEFALLELACEPRADR